MNRRADESKIRTLINKIRTKYPEISLRSTFIVGYPGETRHKFNKLLTFLKQTKLEQVGFFPYSREEGTRAFYLKGQVFEFIKQKRAKKAEEIQSKIAYENNLNQIGKVVEVLVDEFDSENGCYNARMQTQSPNVDFFVKIDCSENVKIGEFCTVQLIDYEGYSFLGTTIF